MAMVPFLLVLGCVAGLASGVDYPVCSTGKPLQPRPRGDDLISNKGLLALYDTAFFFLDEILHPNDLTWMEERGVDFSDPDSIADSFRYDYEIWLEYWVGYLILIGIGMIAMISIFIGSYITCCCRCCCGTCGAKGRQYHNGCPKACCGISLFIIMTLVLFGGVCIILTSIDATDKIDTRNTNSIFNDYADAFDQLQVYIDESLVEVNCTAIGSFDVTRDEVFYTLDHVVNNSLQMVNNKTGATATLTTLAMFTGSLETLNLDFIKAEYLKSYLETNRTQLQQQINTAKVRAEYQLRSCSDPECNAASSMLKNLTVSVDYSQFDFLTGQAVVEELITQDVNGAVQDGLTALDDIAAEINAELQPSLDDAKQMTDDIEAEIVKFIDELGRTLNEADLEGIADSMRNVDVPEWVWDLVYYLLIAMGCLVILVAVFAYIGLLHGCCTQPSPKGETCGTRAQGSHWLLTSVAFIFIFYWIFMIFCAALFAAAGVAHNDVCRHAVKLNDSPITPILNDIVMQYIPDLKATVSDIYTSCGENKAIYTAIKADEMPGLNITELLDLTPLQEEIDKIKAIDITYNSVVLLTNSTETYLVNADNVFREVKKAFVGYDKVLETPITSLPLDDVIIDLLALNDTVDLSNAISEFADAQKTVETMETESKNLQQTMNDIVDIIDLVNLTNAVDEVNAAENYINTQADKDIEASVDTTADSVYYDVESMTHYIDASVRQNVSRCYPAYDSVVLLVDSTCVEIGYPANGLWLALGYCLILFIPAIFIIFCLANLYRASGHSVHPSAPDDIQPDYEDNIINARKTSGVVEMSSMNNPIYLSDEGMRNGYGLGQNDRPSYAGMVNYGYRAQDELPGQIPRELDRRASFGYEESYYPNRDYPNQGSPYHISGMQGSPQHTSPNHQWIEKITDDEADSYNPYHRPNGAYDNKAFLDQARQDYDNRRVSDPSGAQRMRVGVAVLPAEPPPNYETAIYRPSKIPTISSTGV